MISNTSSPFPEEAGVSEMPNGLYGLDRSFPEEFFLLRDEDGDRHILIDALPMHRTAREAITEGFQGMACFDDFEVAEEAAHQLCEEGYPGFAPVLTTFEEARQLVLRKTTDVAALMLLDNPRQPLIHYVR